MVNTIYKIDTNVDDNFTSWLQSQPNLIQINVLDPHLLYVIFDHTAQQSIDFKKLLADKLSTNTQNVAKYIDVLLADASLYTSEFTITKTDVGTTYVNLFTDFGGRPFPVDTTGFTGLAVQTLWNKNAGVGTHFIRIVNHADTTQIIYENVNLTNGENLDANVTIPAQFTNFRGKLRLQVKTSNTTDDPIFSAIRVYLRR